jgi:hypothetical protein
MATYRVDENGFAAFFEAQERDRIERVVAAMHEAATLSAELVARAAPVDVGGLRASIRAERASPSRSEVIADAPHASSVEVGSRPHTPPLAPLIDWVRRHRKALGLKGKLGRDSRGRFTAGAAIEAAARALQRKIARDGTRPRWFMRNTLPKQRKVLDRLIRRRLRDLR